MNVCAHRRYRWPRVRPVECPTQKCHSSQQRFVGRTTEARRVPNTAGWIHKRVDPRCVAISMNHFVSHTAVMTKGVGRCNPHHLLPASSLPQCVGKQPPPSYLQSLDGRRKVGRVALLVVVDEGREVRRRHAAGDVQLGGHEDSEVGAVEHPLRLQVLAREEAVALGGAIHHLYGVGRVGGE